MKNRLKKNIYTGFLVASVLIGLISYFYYKSTVDFIESSVAVQQSTLRSRQLERVLSLLKDAETGERGYIITRQEAFLEPYQVATANLQAQIRYLEQLTDANEYYQKRIPQLDSLISRQIAVLDSNVQLVQQNRLPEVIEAVRSGKAKRLLDAIRESVGSMLQQEEKTLQNLQVIAEQDASINYLVNYIGIGLTLVLFIIGFLIITSDLQKREELEKALLEKNEELVSLNEELNAALEEAHASNEKVREYTYILEEKNHTLEFLNRELEAFSYTISHDLQSPLHTISGFAGLLSQTPAVARDVEAIRQLEIIEKNALRMDGLINDLLYFSRLGKTPLTKASTDMHTLVQNVIAELEAHSNLSGVRIMLENMPRVPADARLMHQVWTNLLSNAIKFSARVPDPEIKIEGRKSGNEYIFSISDNGIGFDLAKGDVFGVFTRLHKREEYAGNGIGLAIVQRIVERHGGSVWAESVPGKGSTFYFTLPA